MLKKRTLDGRPNICCFDMFEKLSRLLLLSDMLLLFYFVKLFPIKFPFSAVLFQLHRYLICFSENTLLTNINHCTQSPISTNSVYQYLSVIALDCTVILLLLFSHILRNIVRRILGFFFFSHKIFFCVFFENIKQGLKNSRTS